MAEQVASTLACSDVFVMDTLESGQPAQISCVDIGGQAFRIGRGRPRTVWLEDEWYADVHDPAAVIEALRENKSIGADIFTFWQRPPHATPQFDYYRELEDVAVLPISTYDEWMSRIGPKTRNMVRKADKSGVTVTVTEYDDEFVRGMTRIFNEAPVRQGRRFWHYGKDFETVKEQFARFIHRETMIRADLDGEMIGLVMLGDAGEFALTQQVISSLEHRDKAVNNALIAKAVEACVERGFRYLCYYYWADDSLTAFKRSCGFECLSLPRYYVPLTRKGEVAIKAGAHRGIKHMIPPGLKESLKRMRRSWNEKH